MESTTVQMSHILVVDDDAAISRLIGQTLNDLGARISFARDGVEALVMVEEQPPELIILDLNMPRMDGRTFYRELRNRRLLMPVLVLSAYGARAAKRELGAEASLDKPFSLEDLEAIVQLLLQHPS